MEVLEASKSITQIAVELLDISVHSGVHPRIGVVDVVPYVPLAGSTIDEAIYLRNSYAIWCSDSLNVPCFLYGPERSLPEVRKSAFRTLKPDYGPAKPHISAGAVAVGARGVLVAYNIWLGSTDLRIARDIASEIRCPEIRALGLTVGDFAQVSCNLIEPNRIGPEQVFDKVRALAISRGIDISRAELVGLVPCKILEAISPSRWKQLDLGTDKTIESRVRGV